MDAAGRRLTRALLPGVLVACLLAACGGEPTAQEEPADRPSASSTPTTSAGPPSVAPSRTPQPPPTRTPEPRPVRGVDASHHQGAIDWVRVRRDRIDFAYLKASEGSSFTDPRFVANARAARKAGLRVGGYHYFSLCSPGAPQAAHFADVLASAPARTMPPAVDLELLGSCSDPPAREELLGEIGAFVDEVERSTGQRVVVYAYPDFEDRYQVRAAIDRRLWVRRIGSTPPAGDWWIWQRDDSASIDGIEGPADLNVMAP